MTDALVNELITNIISIIFHVIWFPCITMEPKYSRKKTVFIMAAVGFFYQILMLVLRYTGILSTIFYYIGYSLAAVIFGAVYIFVISASHSVKTLFLVSAYYCLWTFIYNVVSVATGSFAGAGNMKIWMLRIGLNLFFLLLYQLFFKKRILRVYQDMKHGDSNIAILSLMTFYMLTLLLIYNENRDSYSGLHIYILVSTYVFVVVVYVVLFRFMEQSNYEWRFKQMQLHEKFLLEQIESYKKAEQKAKQTRHDIRHHNIVVAEFAKNKDYQGILDYLQKYEEEEAKKYTRTFCINHAVNHALSAYVAKAEQEGIEVKMDLQFVDTFDISDYDLVSIFANVMENAINGCMQVTEKRWIKLSVRQKEIKLVIVCQNSCSPDIFFDNGIPKNEKRDGVGVESILQSAWKYSGDADFAVNDSIFTCSVILGRENKKT